MSEPQAQSLPAPPEATPPEVGRRLRGRRLGAVRLRFVPSAVRDIAQPGEIPETHATDQSLRRDAVYRRALAAADALAAAIAVIAAFPLLGHDTLTPLAVVILPLSVVLVGKVAGLYDRDEHLLRRRRSTRRPTCSGSPRSTRSSSSSRATW